MTFLFGLMFLGSALYGTELNWLNDYAAAIEQAKKQKKDIYIFIGADRCNFCKKYKEKTLSDKAVMQTLRKEYVPLYLSRDQHYIPKHFKTKGVPRHYFVHAEVGNGLDSIFGRNCLFLYPGAFRDCRFLHDAG